jgi:hypothetical protein
VEGIPSIHLIAWRFVMLRMPAALHVAHVEKAPVTVRVEKNTAKRVCIN